MARRAVWKESEFSPLHGQPFARIGSTLVAADLHIGIERTLALKGFKVPSGTDAMVKRIIKAKASRLVILGDLKDQILTTSFGLEAELLFACEALASAFSEVVLVRGNHDAGLPRELLRHLTVIPASGIVVDSVALQHGHTRPSEASLSARTLAVAHTHPRVELVDGIGKSSFEECWARFPVRKVEDATASSGMKNGKIAPSLDLSSSDLQRVIVVPAANRLCGGAPVNRLDEPLLGPVLSDSFIDRKAGEIHLLDGTELGTAGSIAVKGRQQGICAGRHGRRMSYWDYLRTAEQTGKTGRS